MRSVIAIAVSYLLGSLNPAALLAKIKGIDIRKRGTGNPGATNALINFGKRAGAAVMMFDIAKAFAAVRLAALICPSLPIVGLASGCAAVTGHIFPFYMSFRGGKGLAAFAGMVLALDPPLFALLATVGCLLIFITGHTVALPLSAAALFPILITVRTPALSVFLLSAYIGVLMTVKFLPNVKGIKNGEENKINSYIKKHFTRKNKQ